MKNRRDIAMKDEIKMLQKQIKELKERPIMTFINLSSRDVTLMPGDSVIIDGATCYLIRDEERKEANG